MSVELIHGDCMDYMRNLPDNAFDLAIVDPPYGIKADGHRDNNRSKLTQTTDYHKALWDMSAPDSDYFDELFRVSKNQIIWGANHFAQSIGRGSSCWIVWDKVNGENDFADCELAFTSFKTSARIFPFMWAGMRQGDPANGKLMQGNKKLNEKRIHPTQKPIQLYRWLLSKYADPGQRILDTHLGSGSSAIAAYEFGCDFVGIEIDDTHYGDTKKRVEQMTRQETLFV